MIGKSGLGEDSRGVESNDVNAAHLLGNHDREGCEGSTTNAGDGKELDEAGNVVTLPDDGLLDFKLRVDIVQISRRLQRVVTEPEE